MKYTMDYCYSLVNAAMTYQKDITSFNSSYWQEAMLGLNECFKENNVYEHCPLAKRIE